MNPTPRLEDYMHNCQHCNKLKHLSFFPSPYKNKRRRNVCLDCHRKAGVIAKRKRDVINVMPEYGFYNAKTREKVERDKHSVM